MFSQHGSCTAPLRYLDAIFAKHARAFLFSILLLPAATSPLPGAQNPPPEAERLRTQARAAASTGQWQQAAAIYEQAVELSPHDPALRVELGAAQVKANLLADAIATYNEALKLSPRNLSAEIGLVEAYRAVHNYDAVKRLLAGVRREHPKSPVPLSVLGDFEIELQTYDAAISHLRASLALNPADVSTRDLLAAAYKAKGDQPNALAQLAKVLARDPHNALAYFLRAQIHSDRNEDALALPDAEKVVELQPQNARGHVILGKVLLRAPQDATPEQVTARCARAVATLEPLPETQRNDSETLFLLSRAYRCAGQEDQAQKTLAAFEAASQHERTTKENQVQAKHLVQQANDLALKNDFRGALELLQQALEKDPEYGAAHAQLAKLYYSAGDIEKASAAISRALESAPYEPDFLYVRGKIFEREGKLDEALADFEHTALLNPSESDAYFEIGVISQQRHDRPRALAAYKKAVELSPDDPDYRRALAALAGTSPSQ
jgi:tetratricopeptide (TPR) repeat protein